MASLDKLDSQMVLATMRVLEERIVARFPERGLRRVAGELTSLTVKVEEDAGHVKERLHKARVVSRSVALVVLVGTLVAMALATRSAVVEGPESGLDWLPLIETAINDLVFAAIALFFLYTVPERLQRGHTLELLHRLRSLAHIIDMHQLTKDPERLNSDFTRTAVSPDPGLDRENLQHYLDYCSELLSLVGKAAALCAEHSRDVVVLDTVSTIETLTTGMSRKIWQKISVLPPA